jgi:hypothetical protein
MMNGPQQQSDKPEQTQQVTKTPKERQANEARDKRKSPLDLGINALLLGAELTDKQTAERLRANLNIGFSLGGKGELHYYGRIEQNSSRPIFTRDVFGYANKALGRYEPIVEILTTGNDLTIGPCPGLRVKTGLNFLGADYGWIDILAGPERVGIITLAGKRFSSLHDSRLEMQFILRKPFATPSWTAGVEAYWFAGKLLSPRGLELRPFLALEKNRWQDLVAGTRVYGGLELSRPKPKAQAK